jgi:uncharacterized protein YcbK (DUF882 family)
MKILRTVAICLTLISTSVVGAAAATSLRATRSSQLVQNQRADEDQLSRMEGTAMTRRWVRLQLLEPVSAKTSGYYLHAVREQNRYLRPWTRLFLSRLSTQFRAKFGKPLRVTSLLRTAEYQRSLQGRNGNAASSKGPKRSAHLTGASLDISKKGMTGAERQWLRRVLTSLRGNGYIYAIEEYQQPVFHILVHRKYADYVERKTGSSQQAD